MRSETVNSAYGNLSDVSRKKKKKAEFHMKDIKTQGYNAGLFHSKAGKTHGGFHPRRK